MIDCKRLRPVPAIWLAAGAGFGLSLAGGEIARRHDTSSGGKSSVLMTAASVDTTKPPTQPRDSIAARRPLPTPR